MWSGLPGCVEPGEGIEDATRRETKEEAWAAAQWLLDRMDDETLAGARARNAASDSVGQARMRAIVGDQVGRQFTSVVAPEETRRARELFARKIVGNTEVTDAQVVVIDVDGGDKVPRKGGPGITQSDLLVINKTDLAPHVGADLGVMDRDARKMRGAGPTVFAQVTHGVGVEEIARHVLGGAGKT